MSRFTDDPHGWLESISPNMWRKVNLLAQGESWVMEDKEFLDLLETLAYRISTEDEYLPSVLSDERIAVLVQVISYMHIAYVIRLFDIADPDILFDTTILQWCVSELNKGSGNPSCNVIVARFDWFIQHDLNNRIFGKFTRDRVSKILTSISR